MEGNLLFPFHSETKTTMLLINELIANLVPQILEKFSLVTIFLFLISPDIFKRQILDVINPAIYSPNFCSFCLGIFHPIVPFGPLN